MSHALRCLLAAGCLTLLALAGCSGEQTQPPNANAQANLPGDNPTGEPSAQRLAAGRLRELEYEESVLKPLRPSEQAYVDSLEPLEQRAYALARTMSFMKVYAYLHEDYLPANVFSAQGQPLWSWRVHLLPYFGHRQEYESLHLEEPWDSSYNASILADLPPRLFASHPDTPNGHADIMAVVGDETFGFHPDKPGKKFKLQQLPTEGKHMAILITTSPDTTAPWAKPQDYDWKGGPESPQLANDDDYFFFAVTGDGKVFKIGKYGNQADMSDLFSGQGDSNYLLDSTLQVSLPDREKFGEQRSPPPPVDPPADSSSPPADPALPETSQP